MKIHQNLIQFLCRQTRQYIFIACLIILQFSFNHEACSQQFKLATYQVEQGLPTNMTKAVFQDKNGFMWIGTDVGLLRFDGLHFLHFNNKLSSQYVKYFFETSKNELLVVHDGGIEVIHNRPDTVHFTSYIKGSSDFTDSTVSYPKNIFEDSQNNIWISEIQSIVKYKDGKLKRYHFPEKTRTSSFSRAFQFIEDGNGNFISISQRGFIFLYDKDNDIFQETNIKIGTVTGAIKIEKGKTWIASTDGIHELIIDEKGTIQSVSQILDFKEISIIKKQPKSNTVYLGTWYGGLYSVSISSPKQTFEKVEKLKYKVINDIYINNSGEVWVSSDEGLALLHLAYFTEASIGTERAYIHSVKISKDGLVYTTNGGTVWEINKNDKNNSYRIVFVLETDELILSLAPRKNFLYIGTSYGNIYRYNLENGNLTHRNLSHLGQTIFSLTLDYQNNIWVCQQDAKVLTKITPDDKWIHYGENEGIVSSILSVKDTKKELYCSGFGATTYLYKYDEAKDKFVNISLDLGFDVDDKFGIQDLGYDHEQRLYMASTNQGLLSINKNKKVEKIDLQQSSEVDLVKALAIGDNGGVWVGTDLGLIQYYNNEFLLFDEYNGLPSKTISYRSLVVDEEGQLWVGTASGVGHVQKESRKIKKTPSPVFLSIKVNGKKLDPDLLNKTQEFKYNSFLQASFVSLLYPSKNIAYQYRVIGISDKWSPVTHNEITIPQLTNGSYTLEIRSLKQGEYLWSDPLTLNFKVALPWYMSWWALLCFAIGLSLLIGAFVKLNTQRLLLEKKRLEKIIQERTAEIVNQKEEITMQRDAIEEKSMELEGALEEIRELNATKDKFFSIVAHDLRGPLNSLSGFSDLLVENTAHLTTEEIQKLGKELNRAVKNTFALTDNLLTWARSQMNQSSFQPVITNATEIIESNIELFSAPAKNKNITLIMASSGTVNVLSDKDHLNFIVRNLINNAIKFTFPNGKIEVKAEEKNNMVTISVSDTGVGMTEEVIQRIFRIDSKHTTQGTEGEKGTGLGLSLCKDFVKANGGKIWVESEVGKGSTFYFSLKSIQVSTTPETQQ
jgi:signal transduction histidine kinase/ligand-binding sensor domain-containing protein